MSVSHVLITCEPIDLARLHAELSVPESGAQLLFVGTVRNHNEGQAVSGVTYEVFEPLAQHVCEELIQEAYLRWKSLSGVAIVHRVGELKVGEVSTVIGVSTAHRADSYEASRYLIEQLKVRVPIWKEEHYVEGNKAWLGGVSLLTEDSSGHPGRGEVGADGISQSVTATPQSPPVPPPGRGG